MVAHPVASGGRRFEHIFFSGLAVLILLTVFTGFARSYYLAGLFWAPLRSRLVHVHAIVFSAWIMLLVAQSSLIAAHRTELHRRVGLLGLGLAPLLVVVGLLAATVQLGRAFDPGGENQPARSFYVVPVTNVALFATLIYCAFRARANSPAHKRLIMIGTTALLGAAIARWPIEAAWWTIGVRRAIGYGIPLLLAAYDLFSSRRIHRATLWGTALLVTVQQLQAPIARSGAWQAFAALVQSAARSAL